MLLYHKTGPIFKYLGTSRYDNDYGHVLNVKDRAREKWERMRAEAASAHAVMISLFIVCFLSFGLRG